MTDNRFISPKKIDEELDSNIRPTKLDDFIGQDRIKENLKIFIKASKKRNEVLDHILFYGAPGLGKTTLSQIIATEMNGGIKFISGPSLSKSGDLAAVISNLKAGDILFIDEIHRLPINVEEVLYSVMEDFKIDFMLGEGSSARSIRVDLPKFTLVGATTRYGMLSSPMRDRFGITLQLDFYNVEALEHIITRSAKIMDVRISCEGANEIAKRSRGTPRVANRILRRVRDFLTVSNKKEIDAELANQALTQLGIDKVGLDELDRKYLKSIIDFYKGGPVGLNTLSVLLSESVDTIEDTIEPYLITSGLLIRTPRGRVITEDGLAYFGVKIEKRNTMDELPLN